MGKQDDFTLWILPHLSHRVNENGKRQWKISPLGKILDYIDKKPTKEFENIARK